MGYIGKDDANNGYICECECCGDEFHSLNNRTRWCGIRHIITCKQCNQQYIITCDYGKDMHSCPYCNHPGANPAPLKTSICEQCHHEFLQSSRSRGRYCLREVTYTCIQCNQPFTGVCDGKKHMYCSDVCIGSSDETREKYKNTCIERFGADSNMRNSEHAKKVLDRQRANNGGRLAFNTEKQKSTMIKKYGVTVPYKNDDIKKRGIVTQRNRNGGLLGFNTSKQRDTMIDRYGAPTTLESKILIEKYENTMIARYGAARPSLSPEIEKRILDVIVGNNGHLFGDGSPISKTNIEFADSLKEAYALRYGHGLEVEFEHRIDNSFFDMFLPDYNILIDINPTVTHNVDIPFACLRNGCEQPCTHHAGIQMDYHHHRAVIAYDNGFNLIQVFDNDDRNACIDYILDLADDSSVDYSRCHFERCRYDFSGSFSPFIGGCYSESCFGLYDEDNGLIACMCVHDDRAYGFKSVRGGYFDNLAFMLDGLDVGNAVMNLSRCTDGRMIDDCDLESADVRIVCNDGGRRVFGAGAVNVMLK